MEDNVHEPTTSKEKAAGMTRRDFMKVGAAVAAGGALPLTAGQNGSALSTVAPPTQVDRTVSSSCMLCQARCSMEVQVRDDRVVNVYGRPENEWTGGRMCPKGQSMVELTYSPNRLLYPLLRQGDSWKRIPYKQAVEITAEKILKVKKDFPDDYNHRVALFAPLWESREGELAANMTFHMAGFPDFSHSGDTCIINAGMALDTCLGSMIAETTHDELPNAEVVILFGANIAELYPPCIRWLQKAHEKGTKLIYIDPRKTPTGAQCDTILRPRPGTDGALVMGILNYLISQNLYDKKFVKDHVNGFDLVAEPVKPYTLEKVAQITRLKQDDILNLCDIVARSHRTIAWISGAISRYTNGIQTARAIIAMQALTGNLAGPGKGVLHFQSGKPGGGEAFEEKYSLPDMPGKLHYRKILNNMERGNLKVLLLDASSRRFPDANRTRKAIGKVDFVIHRAFFMDAEAKVSHLIIPGTMAFESEGSQYGLNRQVVWRGKAIEPLGETVPEWRFYTDLGRLMHGSAYPPVQSPADIYELMRGMSPTWGGMSLEHIKASASGIVWPCPSPDGPDGRGTLFKGGRFWTKSGKVELEIPGLGPLAWEEPMGSPLGEGGDPKKFPLIFTQGKVVHHWQQSVTSWSRYMAQFSDGNSVRIHPDTARALNLIEGDSALLETEIGGMPVKVKVTGTVLPGVVWTPSYPDPGSGISGNSGQPVNSIIPGYWDKAGAQFNGFGCRLTRV
jgi:anaerobic selenocysteine-containing dehydrogenase